MRSYRGKSIDLSQNTIRHKRKVFRGDLSNLRSLVCNNRPQSVGTETTVGGEQPPTEDAAGGAGLGLVKDLDLVHLRWCPEPHSIVHTCQVMDLRV